MSSHQVHLTPTPQRVLTQLGEDIRLARLRRRISTTQMAERAGISRPTLLLIEKGSGSVSMGAYVQVLFVLGLEKNLAAVATDDVLGRKLQDAGLLTPKRAPKRPKPSAP